MPMTVQPVDGLIQRLLHQHGRTVSEKGPESAGLKPDFVTISPQAFASQTNASGLTYSHHGSKALETDLFNLYRSIDSHGE